MKRSLQSSTIALLVVFQLPIVGWLVPGKSFGALLAGEGVFWAMTAVVLLYVAFVERRPLSSIGLRKPSWKSLAWGLPAAAVSVGGAVAFYTVIFPRFGVSFGNAAAGLSAVQSTPAWFQLLLITRAAVFEEIFYRGFAIERLSEITKSRGLAAVVSLAAFTYAHLGYWGWAALVVVAFQGAVLTGVYVLRRDLATTMIAHFASDAAAFLLL
ncbi:MAG TPA: type II CAAX endopeptidase family protein [Candidatus Acidoferrales bacterium]|nr:type II CAAX endopeptidase family protein [Candidatus Acidoferrales bacterium]